MTKDNLGSESWQSDQARIAALEARITHAAALVDRYGMTAGEYHQQWLIDQILRALLGEGYDAWVAAYNKPGYVRWDTGIAP